VDEDAMDPTIVVTVTAWIWVLGGAFWLGFVGYLLATERGDHKMFLAMAAAAGGAIGAITLGVRAAGFPLTSLWAWRILASAYLLVSLVRTRFESNATPLKIWPAALFNIAMALWMTVASLIAIETGPSSRIAAARISRTTFTIDGVTMWNGIALGILATGTLAFLILFVRMVERGVAPQVENHWGGIGGGVGGWRLSPSLTYLAAAAVFGVLLGVFVARLGPPKDDDKKQPAKAAATSTATSTAAQK
jgi:hypothetical protein